MKSSTGELIGGGTTWLWRVNEGQLHIGYVFFSFLEHSRISVNALLSCSYVLTHHTYTIMLHTPGIFIFYIQK